MRMTVQWWGYSTSLWQRPNNTEDSPMYRVMDITLFEQYTLSLPVDSLIVYNVVVSALLEQMREETTILVT